MEKRLRKLFDFQRFSGNTELNDVIREVEERYEIGNQPTLLSDDELRNAAGGKGVPFRPYKDLDL